MVKLEKKRKIRSNELWHKSSHHKRSFQCTENPWLKVGTRRSHTKYWLYCTEKKRNELICLVIIVDLALAKARNVPRSRALLKRFSKKSSERPVFTVKYDPRLPAIQSLQAKHWRAMTSCDQYLASVFPEPPLTAFKRQHNLLSMLFRAKVPTKPK